MLVNTSSSGTAPLKLFRELDIRARAHTVLNGSAEAWQGKAQGVSKRTMVGATVVLLQDKRLRVAKSLDLGKVLLNELLTFRMRPPSATDPLEAMREGANGDLVFAVGLACWWGDLRTWNDDVAERMLPADEDMAFEY